MIRMFENPSALAGASIYPFRVHQYLPRIYALHYPHRHPTPLIFARNLYQALCDCEYN